MTIGTYEIIDQPIDVQKYDQLLMTKHGAKVIFTGHVREWTFGHQTSYLEYEAYIDMATKQLEMIGEEVQQKFKGVDVSIVHRIGRLDLTDIAVLIITVSPHRKDCYNANEYVIERIKEVVTIWKKEVYADGEHWVLGQNQYRGEEE
ncbi:molybdopterin synthase subunit 2 [Abyssicoccus albus]|nr:molybdopterin synthase subunit 2 [Abyssicoccus albus]